MSVNKNFIEIPRKKMYCILGLTNIKTKYILMVTFQKG